MALMPMRPRAKKEIISSWEKKTLYGFFALVVIVVGLIQVCEARREAIGHEKTLEFARTQFAGGHMTEPDYIDLTTAESMIGDVVALRHAGLFFGIIGIALGCMLVLTGIETGYQLNLDSPEVKGSLNASSPGLVLITLGVVLAIASLYRSTSIEQHPQAVTAPSDTHIAGVNTTDTDPAKPSRVALPGFTGNASIIKKLGTVPVSPPSFTGSGAQP